MTASPLICPQNVDFVILAILASFWPFSDNCRPPQVDPFEKPYLVFDLGIPKGCHTILQNFLG